MSHFLRGQSLRPNIWAHRGASVLEMENTMPAFRKALDCGADGFELDVRLTSDLQVVVFHDESLERQFGKTLLVSELSLEELREETEATFEIPSLKEVLEEFGGRCFINVEIKAAGLNPKSLVQETLKVIKRGDCLDSVLVSSFDPKCLALSAWLEPNLKRALLFGAKTTDGFGFLSRLGKAAFSAIHPQSVLVSKKSVKSWHKRGQAIHTWTVDDPKEIIKLSKLGVDSIITNTPDVALGCF